MSNTELPDIPTTALVGLAVLAFVSLTLCFAGIIAVAKTPERALPGGLHRAVWILICFIQFVGPIVFFVLRRRERGMVVDEVKASDLPEPDDHGIIERLYG